MAIFIFSQNNLYRIAANQEIYNSNKNFPDSLYEILNVSDEDFNGIKYNTKIFISKTETNIVTQNIEMRYNFASDLKNYIDMNLKELNQWVEINKEKPLTQNIIQYVNFLKTINPITLINDQNPLMMSLETYAQNQGIIPVNFYELL
jgi:hypothetical protein